MVSHWPNIFATSVSVNLTEVHLMQICFVLFIVFICWWSVACCTEIILYYSTPCKGEGLGICNLPIPFHKNNSVCNLNAVWYYKESWRFIMKWYTRYRRQFDWLITTINLLTSFGFQTWVHSLTSCAQLNTRFIREMGAFLTWLLVSTSPKISHMTRPVSYSRFS
jgi:hypothetical protein